LDEELLWRQSGSVNRIKEIIYALNSGDYDIKLEPGDAHNCTGVVLSFFRDCPDRLFTPKKLYEQLLHLHKLDSTFQATQAQELLAKLPKCNYEIIKLISQHLARIVETNKKMTPKALCGALGPGFCTIFQPLVTHSSSVFKK